ncbi:hypothetical protein [Streptomyces sp. NRRL WC-3549]|uniref:hypothetical protein n=1 Tax=Streptomyces sp. NRRL WC-3549 TaxID=1463925 RepID=UPI0004C8A0BE|nr:hypothetical protein [Streptomyces sp. NRRL WC-3549]
MYADGAHDPASTVKADILAALLLRTQDEGRQPSGAEPAHVDAMIRRSDDASATEPLKTVGGAEAPDVAHERLGLTAEASDGSRRSG